MTASQRFHLEAYGYVLLDQVLSLEEVDRYKDVLYRIKLDKQRKESGIYVLGESEHLIHMGNVVNYDAALIDFATHPKLIPLVENVVGGSVRLEESEAIINRRNPKLDVEQLRLQGCTPTSFHTGTRHGWGTYFERERFHCLFTKTIAFLTDVGPGDGGTAVIPGSHKMSWPEPEMIEAAMADRRLITQIEAKAGSVLLFVESLIHSTTEIYTENERVILVCGYTPPMFRAWPGNELSAERIASAASEVRPILSGEESWYWRRNPQC